MRSRVVLVGLAAVLLVLGAATTWWATHRSTAYESALNTLPASTLRASYTDWREVRAQVKTKSLGRFVEDAYDADLSRGSALENSSVQLDEHYGISTRDADWEIYGQSEVGAVAVLRVPETLSFDMLRARLRSLGYDAPVGGDAAWSGTPELLAGISTGLTPVEENVLLMPEDGLVLFSDTAGYAEDTAAVITGDSPSVLAEPHVSELAALADQPVSSVLWASDFACEALSMGAADDADQAKGRQLVDAVDGVDPVTGLMMSRNVSEEVTVAMSFESSEQADENLQPRTDLASGDAPGQGGSFADRFRLLSGRSQGTVVVLRLEPRSGAGALFSDISDGPVLFATC